jgi:NADPH-dependent glutamate synthase beta subunit-like oxidoreductase
MLRPYRPLDEPWLEEIEPRDGENLAGHDEKKIGQGPNPLHISELKDIARGKHGNVIVDEEGRTSITHVFAGDDIATGVATIILAMGTAKTAAQAIDRMLKKD